MRNFLIAVHGSVLTCPTPRDIDVIVDQGDHLEMHRTEIEALVRSWAKDHAYDIDGRLPLDIKECSGIPALPFAPAPVYEILQGTLPEKSPIRVQYDLAAWIRACESSDKARDMFALLFDNPSGENPGRHDKHIIFTTASDPNLQSGFGAYQGGGRFAVEAAAEKCKNGWTYVSGLFCAETKRLVRKEDHTMSSTEADSKERPKKLTGFALMTPEDRNFKCHRWNKKTAALAGSKGACHDPERMRALGRKGGKARGEQLQKQAAAKGRAPRKPSAPKVVESPQPETVVAKEVPSTRIELLRQRAELRKVVQP